MADETAPEVAPKKGKKTADEAVAAPAETLLPADVDYADGKCLGEIGTHVLSNGFTVITY